MLAPVKLVNPPVPNIGIFTGVNEPITIGNTPLTPPTEKEPLVCHPICDGNEGEPENADKLLLCQRLRDDPDESWPAGTSTPQKVIAPPDSDLSGANAGLS